MSTRGCGISAPQTKPGRAGFARCERAENRMSSRGCGISAPRTSPVPWSEWEMCPGKRNRNKYGDVMYDVVGDRHGKWRRPRRARASGLSQRTAAIWERLGTAGRHAKHARLRREAGRGKLFEFPPTPTPTSTTAEWQKCWFVD